MSEHRGLWQGLWFITLLGLLISCLSLSWLLQAQAHYGYHYWYDLYRIDAHIQRFGPQNRFIHGLEQLPRHEHERLFNEIRIAVHEHGQGLADIQFDYHGRSQRLLRAPEVGHLQDVANLIDRLRQAAVWIAAVTLLLLVFLLYRRCRPRWRVQLLWLGGLVLGTLAAVLLIGPKAVFYQLHVWIFPADHPWFFYYQESLMSTLMKAPYLFGGIGAAIALGGVLLLLPVLWGLQRLYNR